MLSVTENAAAHLKRLLDENRSRQDQVIRLTSKGEADFQVVLDDREPGDQVVKVEGEEILVIDEGIRDLLEGLELDFVDSPEEPGLSLHLKAGS